MANIYDFKVKNKSNEDVSLESFRGKTLLIVNTASACGFTPQYKGLQAMYDKNKDKGFEVLAFPCNQFGAQEPGTDEEIQDFCMTEFGVSFPVFKKIDVNGEGADPLYQFLKEEAPGILGSKAIKWNFTKFLVDKDGKVLKRYAPKDSPESIEKELSDHLS